MAHCNIIGMVIHLLSWGIFYKCNDQFLNIFNLSNVSNSLNNLTGTITILHQTPYWFWRLWHLMESRPLSTPVHVLPMVNQRRCLLQKPHLRLLCWQLEMAFNNTMFCVAVSFSQLITETSKFGLLCKCCILFSIFNDFRYLTLRTDMMLL